MDPHLSRERQRRQRRRWTNASHQADDFSLVDNPCARVGAPRWRSRLPQRHAPVLTDERSHKRRRWKRELGNRCVLDGNKLARLLASAAAASTRVKLLIQPVRGRNTRTNRLDLAQVSSQSEWEQILLSILRQDWEASEGEPCGAPSGGSCRCWRDDTTRALPFEHSRREPRRKLARARGRPAATRRVIKGAERKLSRRRAARQPAA